MIEEAMAHWGLLRQINKQYISKAIQQILVAVSKRFPYSAASPT